VSELEAAVEVAVALGLRVEEPVPLRSTNNIVVWLRPSMVVAKVGCGHHRRLADELQVALELSLLGGPVMPPASEVPQIVHRQRGYEITFWRYYPQPSSVTISSKQLAAALRRLHEICRQISPGMQARLPSFLEELGTVRAALTDPARLISLAESDRLLLLNTFDRLGAELRATTESFLQRVIHGSPHGFNVLLAEGEPRFIDFETVCRGPVEWDLAHLDPEVEREYGEPLNDRLARACRGMASVKTATWCWAEINRDNLRAHAEFHLAQIRERFGMCTPQ
jgi:aminoglycoside phosphotransferase (APT) family kinase protein